VTESAQLEAGRVEEQHALIQQQLSAVPAPSSGHVRYTLPTASSPTALSGDLLVGGVPFKVMDAGLGPRSAVHVMDGVMASTSVQEQLEALRRALGVPTTATQQGGDAGVTRDAVAASGASTRVEGLSLMTVFAAAVLACLAVLL